MEFMDYAVINFFISISFGVVSVALKVPPYGAIPNGVVAVGFYILAVTQ